MSVTNQIILVPNANVSLLQVMQTVVKKLNEKISEGTRQVVKDNDEVINVPHLRSLVRKDDEMKAKYGIWHSVAVHSPDCFSFHINIGLGDQATRSVTVTETVETHEEINSQPQNCIGFLLSSHGKAAEILEIIGDTCKDFGATYKIDNDHDVVKRYNETETA